MKNVSSLLFFFFFVSLSFGQSSQEKLKKEQQKLEKRISNTRSLLSKVKSNTQASLNEIRLIENQIKSRLKRRDDLGCVANSVFNLLGVGRGLKITTHSMFELFVDVDGE